MSAGTAPQHATADILRLSARAAIANAALCYISHSERCVLEYSTGPDQWPSFATTYRRIVQPLRSSVLSNMMVMTQMCYLVVLSRHQCVRMWMTQCAQERNHEHADMQPLLGRRLLPVGCASEDAQVRI